MQKSALKTAFVLAVFLLSLVLTACGGSDSTPAPVSPVANTTSAALVTATTAAPTAVPTTSAPTTAPVPTATLAPTPVPPSPTPSTVAKLPFLVVGNPSAGGALRAPHDAVVDSAGNFIVADFDTQKLVKFDKDGKFKSFLEPEFPEGKSPGRPSYLAVDAANNLYVAYFNGDSYKLDPSGKNLGKFGDSEFGSIYSLASDKAGNIYTVTSRDYLVKYDKAGKATDKLKAGQKSGDKLGEGQFNYNAKVRVDPAGNLFLFEQYDPARVMKFGTDFKFDRNLEIPKQKDGSPSQISEVTFDNNGNPVVVNYEKVWKFDKSGKLLSETESKLFNLTRLLPLPEGGYFEISNIRNGSGKADASFKITTPVGKSNDTNPGQFRSVESIVADEKGNFYTAEAFGSRIQKFDKTGKLLLVIDEKVGGFDFVPNYLALDKTGNLYSAGGSTVYKFSPAGQKLASFGKYGKATGEFQAISGLAVDSTGNIYVGDTETASLKKFDSTGKYLSEFSLKEKDSDSVYTISILLDPAGNLLVGRGSGNGLLTLGADGKIRGQLSPNNKLVTELGVIGLATDTNSNIYALSSSSQQPLTILDKQGQIKATLGSEGLKSLEFLDPRSIAVDPGGNIYVGEDTGARVQRWHPDDSSVKVGNPIPASALASPGSAPAATAPASQPTTAPTNPSGSANSSGTAGTPFNFSSVSGLKELALDPTLLAVLQKTAPPVKALSFSLLASGEDLDTVAGKLDSAVTSAGYKFGIPGETKPFKSDNQLVGFYSKEKDDGSPEILFGVFPVPSNEAEVNKIFTNTNIDPAQAAKFLDQLKGSKTLVVAFTAPGLLTALFQSAGNSTSTPGASAATAPPSATTAAAITQVPATTPAASTAGNTSGTAIGGDVPVYPGSSKIEAASTSTASLLSDFYVSKDDSEKIVSWAKTAFPDKGWTVSSTVEVGGATFLVGKKGNSNLTVTILGKAARKDSTYDSVFTLAKAGPDDSVIFVTIAIS